MNAPNTDIRITGLGLVSPLGHSPWSTFRALLDGRTTADRLSELPAQLSPTEIARGTASFPASSLTHEDPSVALAELAAKQALDDAGRTSVDRTVVACSKGAVHLLTAPAQTVPPPPEDLTPRIAALTPHGYLAARLRERLHSFSLGTLRLPVAACATSLVGLHDAVRAIQNGHADSALVVSAESSLTSPFVECYRRLGVLAPTDPTENHRCRPLDTNRAGFTLCEASAAIVLERTTEPRGHARIHRTAIGTEPFDLLRAPKDFSTLRRLVRDALDSAPTPALVHPHATGTPDNDERELRAIESALGSAALGTRLYASKGAIGHAMGAAGLINVVLSCLMGRARRTPPMPWLHDPIKTSFACAAAPTAIPDGTHLIVSAGFGGHTAAVSLVPGG